MAQSVEKPISSEKVTQNVSVKKRKIERNNSFKLTEAIYHLICTLIFIGIFWYDNKIESECPQPRRFFPGSGSFGGRLKYLTQINMVVLFTYYCTALVHDFLPSSVRSRKLTSLIDWFFTTVVWSLSFAVFILFWGIYAIDRELVYPKHLDEYIPFHLNHMWHTVILPVVIFEAVFVLHRHPSYRVVLATLITFSVGYVTWTYIVFTVVGKWPYPFQKNLGVFGFGIFAAICTLFIGMFYYLGRVFSFRIWGQ